MQAISVPLVTTALFNPKIKLLRTVSQATFVLQATIVQVQQHNLILFLVRLEHTEAQLEELLLLTARNAHLTNYAMREL